MSLKHDTFWFCVSFAFVAGLFLGGFMGAIATKEHGRTEPTYRIIIEHIQAPVLTEADVQQQAIYPIPPGKRRPIEEQLSPAMEKAEHWRAVRAILDGKTNLLIQQGPRGPR